MKVLVSTILWFTALCATTWAQEPTPVRTILPAPASASSSYEMPGRTEPIEQARVFSRATGIVRERLVDVGDRVKQGDILALIDAPEIDRGIEAAQAAIDQAVARSQTAESAARRSVELLEVQAVSTEETEERRASAAELAASVRAAEAELARLQVLQNFATVRAPFDATVAERRIDRGDFIRGDASTTAEWMFYLVRLRQLRFIVAATPDVALRLPDGTEGIVRFAELPGREFPAQVSRSSNVFDETSGTMRVELILENPKFELPAGLTGLVRFQLSPVAGTFLVPNNTLVFVEGKSLVAAVEDNKVRFIEVLPGRNLGAQVEVLSSELRADLPLIVSPNALLRAGDPVNATPLETAAPKP